MSKNDNGKISEDISKELGETIVSNIAWHLNGDMEAAEDLCGRVMMLNKKYLARELSPSQWVEEVDRAVESAVRKATGDEPGFKKILNWAIYLLSPCQDNTGFFAGAIGPDAEIKSTILKTISESLTTIQGDYSGGKYEGPKPASLFE